MENRVLLEMNNLKVWYKTYRGYSKVVDGVSMLVNRGEKIGLVGESGCGKTTTMKAIMRLQDGTNAHIQPDSEILLEGENVLAMGGKELLQLHRHKVSMISQSPMAALNPVFTVGQQMMDVIKYSGSSDIKDKKGMEQVAKQAIADVMISDPDRIMNTYPHQLSGGMRQRICIATALVTPCELIIADEPGTALDVTVQEQIHQMLREQVEQKQRALIMITHSLGVARELVDRIYVMYAGNIVESCPVKDLFDNPCHPYTIGLLECVPRLSGGGLSAGIYGYVPDYVDPPKGCRFSNRCNHCMDICLKKKPEDVEVSPGHKVTCFKYI